MSAVTGSEPGLPADGWMPSGLVTRGHPFQIVHSAVVHCPPREFAALLHRLLAALRAIGFEGHAFTPDTADLSHMSAASANAGQRGRRVFLASTASEPGQGPTGFYESCATLFGELTRHEIWAFVEGDSRSAAEQVLGAVDAILAPFTNAEQAELAELNPLVRCVAEHYRESGVDLSATTLLFREHLLLEKVNLLSGLLRLGLAPQRTVVLGKPDVTFYRRRVIAHLRQVGMTVLDSTVPLHGIERRLDAYGNGPVVVVDDGAELALALLRSGRVANRPAVIETTAKGIRVLRQAGMLDRVLNLSDTSVKHDMAGRIATSCVFRFRELMRHEPLEGESCLLVGYGMLGSQVALLLRQMGLAVLVVEVDADARRQAQEVGFAVFPDIMSAARPSVRYVFGCSGEHAVDLAVISKLGPDVVLCALSSQDLIPVWAALRTLAVARPVRGVGTRFRLDGRTVTVLADGHAINLHYAEGVSEPDYDMFTALTCAAIVESAQGLTEANAPRPDPEQLCAMVRGLDVMRADHFG